MTTTAVSPFTMKRFLTSLVLWLLVIPSTNIACCKADHASNNNQDGGGALAMEAATLAAAAAMEGFANEQEDASCPNTDNGRCQEVEEVVEEILTDALKASTETEELHDEYVSYDGEAAVYDVEYEDEEDEVDDNDDEDEDDDEDGEYEDVEYDPESLGETQRFVFVPGNSDITTAVFLKKLQEVDEYMLSVAKDPELNKLVKRCKNHHEHCTIRAMKGDCEDKIDEASGKNHRPWMLENCAPACLACDMLLYERRCPYDPNSPKAWEEPNALNKMFERIISEDKFKVYNPKVWSRPAWEEANPDYYDTPWIVSLDNFISDEEIERLLEIAADHGYERSDDGGEYLEDGSFVTHFMDLRTSYNSWCGTCYDDPLGQAVLERIEDVTQIDKTNYNFLQMLRYRKGQKYETHHDYDYYSVPRQPGPRIVTFFMYLSDVEEGGETNFPSLGLTFKPKKGRVVIWPNVMNDDPFEWDPMTQHQALPVKKGVKYAANAWIHMHDYQKAYEKNCSD